MTRLLLALITVVVFGCSSSPSEKPSNMVGKWKAQWETFPESNPDVKDIKSFTMDGRWTFNKNGTITVEAFGFPGCIFGEDTLNHTQNWTVKNDTLFLINENEVYGMSYKIVSRQDEKMKLQLMADIFVNLEK